jgi:adenylylsulfate kinase
MNTVGRIQRQTLHGHRSRVVWFTGLSGAGKTTLAQATEHALYKAGYRTFTIDGDAMRTGLCSDLGYDDVDRQENMRRLAEVAALMAEAGIIVLVAAISPRADARRAVKERLHQYGFMEVYVRASLEVCEKRDVKGLYAKARAGTLQRFTGIHQQYDEPLFPDVTCDTERDDVATCVKQILREVQQS